jgi:NAD(P)-dependent dehydrogenase (short-subunit alcohol dehydrogenase family)
VIARSAATVEKAAAAVAGDGSTALALVADSTDEAGLLAALDTAVAEHGVPEVLVHNAGWIRADRPGALSARELLDTLAVNVVGAIVATTHVAPAMAGVGGGTVLLTGGMPVLDPEVTSLSLGKASLRAAAELLAREYAPAGVHVTTITVGGAVTPGGRFDPDEIAERYWAVHRQPAGEWQPEVLYSGPWLSV